MARGQEMTRHLKAGAREGGVQRSRLRVALLVLQTAMSVLLLVGAGLFVRSLDNVRRQPLGFDPRSVLYVDIAMADVRLEPPRAVELRERLLVTAAQLPSVQRAALAYSLPLGRPRVGGGFRVPGMDSLVRMRMPDLYVNAVSLDYFATIGTRILRGRGIGVEDAAGAPGAMVVSATLARLLWPGQDPLGRCVHFEANTACTNVVGVAEDVRATTLHDDPVPHYYLSSAQFRPTRRSLVLRMHGRAAEQAESVRAALQREMPGASYVTVKPFSGMVTDAMRSWRLGATMFALFGGLALVLAAVGLYGVIAYNVTQRTHEIGVRIALGARVADVLWLVVRQGVVLGVVGVAIGTTITLGAAGQVATLLFGVSARDPMIYASVAGAMLFVAFAASFIPAHRAARVDPTVALRSD
jgi:predicted permease